MSSLEEINQMHEEAISGMHAFYDSLEGDHNPVQVVGRMQGKINDLIDYILALEEYINALPCVPRSKDKPESAKICPYRIKAEAEQKEDDK